MLEKVDGYLFCQDFWKSLEEEWDELSSAAGEQAPTWLSFDEGGGYDDAVDGLASRYEFIRDNPTLDAPNALEEGKARLKEGRSRVHTSKRVLRKKLVLARRGHPRGRPPL